MKSVQSLWSSILADLKKELSATAVKTWFDDVIPVLLDEKSLILYCKTDFKREAIEKYYIPSVEKILKQKFAKEIPVRFFTHQEYSEYQDTMCEGRRCIQERERYRFHSFVVGESNKLAFNSAQYVAAGFDQFCNPLIIYGGSGLGKTHLLNAIVAAVRVGSPSSNIVYTRGDMFTNEMVEAIKSDTNTQFRAKHRCASLFIMDDAQFIGGKKATQEELLNTFDELYSKGCSIVLAMDRAPNELCTLEDRIRSRFEGGLVVQIQEPEYETRLQIVKNKAAERSLCLKDEDMIFIAENVTGSVRRIEGILNYLNMKVRTEGTFGNIRDAVSETFTSKPTSLTPDELIHHVAKAFGIEKNLIPGKARTKDVMLARQVCMYLLCQELGMSTTAVGKLLKKDHTTVIYGIQKVEDLMNADAHFSARVNQLIARHV